MIEESAAEIKLTSELDPFSQDMSLCFGWHCLFTKAYDEAIELASKGVQMKTEVAWSEVILGWSYEQKSMFREAITEFQNAVAQ